MKATNHLSEKDHLLRRAENLMRESSRPTSRASSIDATRDDGPLRTRRDFKTRQYYRDLQLWVEGDPQ